MQPIKQTIIGAGLMMAAGLAQAGMISITGDHFTFSYDEAQVSPLYKQALLSGSQDTVYFLPTAFTAVTGGAPATTQAGLQFTLSIDPGYVFAGLAFAENGNYFLSNGGRVRASASLQAVNLDTSASGGLALNSGDALGHVGGTTSWELAGLLGPQGLGAVENLQVTLANTLTSEPVSGIGLIRKTYVGFSVHTREQAVPEPSGLALMLGGMFAAMLAARRRRL
jgi:hypothetical protein